MNQPEQSGERGNYDDYAARVQAETNAEGVLLIVLGGNKGTGFSVVATERVVAAIPRIIRDTADMIEKTRPERL